MKENSIEKELMKQRDQEAAYQYHRGPSKQNEISGQFEDIFLQTKWLKRLCIVTI